RLPQMGGWGNRRQVADPVDLARWLRCGGKLRQEEREREKHDECDGLHRITSSAWNSSVGGIIRPRTWAVFMLMTNSNCIGCSIGRSPGLAPLRILATYVAARRQRSSVGAPYDIKPPHSAPPRVGHMAANPLRTA